jgi:hypothetical protein
MDASRLATAGPAAPASLVLADGAGSGPWIFRGRAGYFPGSPAAAARGGATATFLVGQGLGPGEGSAPLVSRRRKFTKEGACS